MCTVSLTVRSCTCTLESAAPVMRMRSPEWGRNCRRALGTQAAAADTGHPSRHRAGAVGWPVLLPAAQVTVHTPASSDSSTRLSVSHTPQSAAATSFQLRENKHKLSATLDLILSPIIRNIKLSWGELLTGKHFPARIYPFTVSVSCSFLLSTYLDRKDVCSVSCVHRKEFLVVQRVPHNGMLVIRARGQQAKRNRRQICTMNSSVPHRAWV